jgi:hypothetical protein
MNESTRKLLSGALAKHESCLRDVAGVHGQGEVIRRLVEIEQKAWSESPVEAENLPLTYRHLLTHLHDPSLIEQRYGACEHDYLKAIAAQRYAELLGTLTDVGQLMELAVKAHVALRPFVILRFQQLLADALKSVSADAMPRWFTRLLMQPSEMLDFLSQSSCNLLMGKVEGLLKEAA